MSDPTPASTRPSRSTALRGSLVFCRDDPFLTDPATAFCYESDGLVLCRDGLIVAAGPVADIKPLLQPDTTIADYSGCLIAPGFIDTHIHYVQTGVIGSQAKDLLDWLERYTFIAEQAFADPQVAASTARVFCEELLRNGTTTALVFCSVHAGSVDALFTEAARHNLRLIAGKHRAVGLRSIQSIDCALAWPRPRALCDHAALCRLEHA
jgi:guanine deaminase